MLNNIIYYMLIMTKEQQGTYASMSMVIFQYLVPFNSKLTVSICFITV